MGEAPAAVVLDRKPPPPEPPPPPTGPAAAEPPAVSPALGEATADAHTPGNTPPADAHAGTPDIEPAPTGEATYAGPGEPEASPIETPPMEDRTVLKEVADRETRTIAGLLLSNGATKAREQTRGLTVEQRRTLDPNLKAMRSLSLFDNELQPNKRYTHQKAEGALTEDGIPVPHAKAEERLEIKGKVGDKEVRGAVARIMSSTDTEFVCSVLSEGGGVVENVSVPRAELFNAQVLSEADNIINSFSGAQKEVVAKHIDALRKERAGKGYIIEGQLPNKSIIEAASDVTLTVDDLAKHAVDIKDGGKRTAFLDRLKSKNLAGPEEVMELMSASGANEADFTKLSSDAVKRAADLAIQRGRVQKNQPDSAAMTLKLDQEINEAQIQARVFRKLAKLFSDKSKVSDMVTSKLKEPETIRLLKSGNLEEVTKHVISQDKLSDDMASKIKHHEAVAKGLKIAGYGTLIVSLLMLASIYSGMQSNN